MSEEDMGEERPKVWWLSPAYLTAYAAIVTAIVSGFGVFYSKTPPQEIKAVPIDPAPTSNEYPTAASNDRLSYTLLSTGITRESTSDVLTVRMRAANHGESSLEFSSRQFRLEADGHEAPPSQNFNYRVLRREQREADLTFNIPKSSSDLALWINAAPNPEIRIPIHLLQDPPIPHSRDIPSQ